VIHDDGCVSLVGPLVWKRIANYLCNKHFVELFSFSTFFADLSDGRYQLIFMCARMLARDKSRDRQPMEEMRICEKHPSLIEIDRLLKD